MNARTPTAERRGPGPGQQRTAAVRRGPDASAAVVVGLDSSTGLQSARVLSRSGVPVIGVAADPSHPCCRTRACRRVLAADTSGPGMIEVLVRLGRELEDPAVLVPCTDMSVLVISRHREDLRPWFRIGLPEPDVVELLVDKEGFYSYAQRERLPIPRTHFLRTIADAERAADALRFPCIVKPALKTREWKRHAAAKAYRISSAAELLRRYGLLSSWADVLVAQDWIEGGDGNHYTCNCYLGAASDPLVTFTSRKLRQWPPIGGEGCLSEESRNDVVERETVRVFQAVGLRGLGYLEWKLDERTGEHLIIEPNIGRPTGRSACAEAAGVDLLYTMYCDLVGRPLPPRRQQTYRGVKWIHFRRDVQAALFHWWRGDLSFGDWLRSWRGPKVDALFSWRDPLPFWADLGRVAADRMAGRKRKARVGADPGVAA